MSIDRRLRESNIQLALLTCRDPRAVQLAGRIEELMGMSPANNCAVRPWRVVQTIREVWL